MSVESLPEFLQEKPDHWPFLEPINVISIAEKAIKIQSQDKSLEESIAKLLFWTGGKTITNSSIRTTLDREERLETMGAYMSILHPIAFPRLVPNRSGVLSGINQGIGDNLKLKEAAEDEIIKSIQELEILEIAEPDNLRDLGRMLAKNHFLEIRRLITPNG